MNRSLIQAVTVQMLLDDEDEHESGGDLLDLYLINELVPNVLPNIYRSFDDAISLGSRDCYQRFRFEPCDLARLHQCLRLPAVISCKVVPIIILIHIFPVSDISCRIEQQPHLRKHSSSP